MPGSAPTKFTVRRYLAERVASHKPPPTQKEIRRKLGWDLLDPHHKRLAKVR